jgi:hypothetical protein
MRRSLVIAVGFLGIGSALGYTIGHARVAPTRPPSAARSALTDSERALLAPVTEGGKLADFDVTEVHPIAEDGGLRLACRKEHAIVRLEIVRASPGTPTPAVTEGPYAIYYSVQDASPADGESLATALAAILRTNAGVPVPSQLPPFKAGHP